MTEFSINVKYQATNNAKVSIGAKNTVAELKERISEETKVPASEIKLIFKGKILKNETETMEDLNIVADSAIHMI